MNLDPTIGHEIKKSRPCAVISPDEINHSIKTVIIAPMTTKSHEYPTRVEVEFLDKKGFIVLDQIRSVDKTRLIKMLGKLEKGTIKTVKNVLREMLVD